MSCFRGTEIDQVGGKSVLEINTMGRLETLKQPSRLEKVLSHDKAIMKIMVDWDEQTFGEVW